MKDLALHILDILENSARAGAERVHLRFSFSDGRLAVEIEDNGPGLPAAVADDPCDPFRTTRTERAVGMGLSLLRQAVEQADGRFDLISRSPGGVRLSFEYDASHIDAKPLGDLAGIFVTALLAWPQLRITVALDEASTPSLDSKIIRESIEGVELTHPRIQPVLKAMSEEAFAPLYAPHPGESHAP